MPLCQPYFRALQRSFAAAWLLSGLMAALWLVAAYAFAQIFDAHLARQPLVSLLPLGTVLAIAVTGACMLQQAISTIFNRRQIWLEHGLGERVLAHELWAATDPRQRDRKLAAVMATGAFVGSRLAMALAHAPWALLIVACLWFVQFELAALASASSLLLIVIAVIGSRISKTARKFDGPFAAIAAGQNIVHRSGINHASSMEYAQTVAAHWEETQRSRVTMHYSAAQVLARRSLCAVLLVATFAIVLGALALEVPLTSTFTPGALFVTCGALVMTQVILAHWAINAPVLGAARAARRELMSLRVSHPRERHSRLAAVPGPDLRTPIATGLLATAAAAAALFGAVSFWQLPLVNLARDKLTAAPHSQQMTDFKQVSAKTNVATTRPALNNDANTTVDLEIRNLRTELGATQQRLTELRQEAETLAQPQSQVDTTAYPAHRRLREIEAAASALSTAMKTIVQRIAALELTFAKAANPPAQQQPINDPPSGKDLS